MKRILSLSVFFLVLTVGISSLAFAEDTQLTTGVAITDGMQSMDDVNVYQFTTDRDGEVYITVDERTSGNIIGLYDEQGKTVWNTNTSNKDGIIAFGDYLKQGKYTIKIESHTWSTVTTPSYRLRVTFSSPFTRDGKTFEPNDTIETALPIQSGIFYKSNGEFLYDRDTYQFTNPVENGDIYITLDERNTDFNINILNEQRKTVWNGNVSRKDSSVILNKTLAKGTYYIKIEPINFTGITNASYRLKATYPSSFTRNYSTFEPNETIETAMPIRRGQWYPSKGDTLYDVDTYKFTTNKSGEVSITLDEKNTDFTWKLVDQQGKTLWNGNVSRTEYPVILNKTLAKGTYYIKINPINFNGITSASYRLKVNFSANTTIYTDLETNQEWSEGILWAVDKKILDDFKNIPNKKTGKKENLLKPHEKLTEAQLLTVLSRYGKKTDAYKSKTTEKKLITRGKMAEILVSIHTGKKVSEKEAIDFFIKNGLTTAKTTKDFKPSAGLTRAEIATFLKKYDTLVKK